MCNNIKREIFMPNKRNKKAIFDLTKESTLGDILRWGKKEFKKAKLHFGHGTDNAWDEAVHLALCVLNLPCEVDKRLLKVHLSIEKQRALFYLIKKRVQERVPAAYLTKTACFAGLPFYVDERVLIPRSSIVELINNEFAPWIKKNEVKRILDLGTGSGALAIAAAKIFPKAKVDAVDCSAGALKVAAINVKCHKVGRQVKLIKSDLWQKLKNKKYDIIISNPPYVTAKEYKKLPREYYYEPKEGLLAGPDGLQFIRTILKEAPNYLSPHGILVVEVGNREKELPKIFPKTPFIWPDFESSEGGVFVLLGNG